MPLTLAGRMRNIGLAATAALTLMAATPAPAFAALPYAAGSPAFGVSPTSGVSPLDAAPRPTGTPLAATAGPVRRACPGPLRPGQVTCLALVRTDVVAHRGVQPQARPSGLGALDLQHAYNLPSASGGRGQTIAIINVFDNPHAEADLAVYRAQYGLPPCTAANGCFRKVNATGGTTLPRPDVAWGEEQSLDLDMVSAACPNCHILVVEADQPAIRSLGVGVVTAVRLGAKYVSNSYGGLEESTARVADFRHFDHPGVAVTAASGDGGYGLLFPASSPHVTAVGGTSLRPAANSRGWAETAWSGAGSGCSTYSTKPAWQKDAGCPRRTVADVSAVADPHTGVAVYDTYGFGGWQVVGGTSAAAPIIAGAYALAGSPDGYAASLPYAHPAALNDVVQGRNGTCTPAYLCTAGPGYDGPTGLGTPNGVNAFRATKASLAKAARRRGPRSGTAPGTLGTPGTAGGASRTPGTAGTAGGASRAVAAAGTVAAARRSAAGSTAAAPGGAIANGGFESGNFSGWSASGVVSTVTRDHPHSGRYAARLGHLDDPAKGDSSVRQSFVAPKGRRRLSFWYNVSCPDKVRYDWATASLRDDTAGTDRLVLERTCTYDDTWRQITAPITGGHTYTLTLSNHDDGYYGDPTSTKYDDVSTS